MDKHLVMDQDYGSRVPKYQHLFCNTQFGKLRFSEQEYAVVCLLLLRGPQTPGELKARSERLCHFGDLTEVETTVNALITREDGPFVARLPRELHRKDHCYAHLFSGDVDSVQREEPIHALSSSSPRGEGKFTELEMRIEQLERALAEVKEALGME